jgi:hypothetical protein
MKIEIESITIIIDKYHQDKIYLHPVLPPSYWPYDETPSLALDAAKGTGIEYCKANFPGVPVGVIKNS